jgi:hypothetical protein
MSGSLQTSEAVKEVVQTSYPEELRWGGVIGHAKLPEHRVPKRGVLRGNTILYLKTTMSSAISLRLNMTSVRSSPDTWSSSNEGSSDWPARAAQCAQTRYSESSYKRQYLARLRPERKGANSTAASTRRRA